jgi:hypothetical protein
LAVEFDLDPDVDILAPRDSPQRIAEVIDRALPLSCLTGEAVRANRAGHCSYSAEHRREPAEDCPESAQQPRAELPANGVHDVAERLGSAVRGDEPGGERSQDGYDDADGIRAQRDVEDTLGNGVHAGGGSYSEEAGTVERPRRGQDPDGSNERVPDS